MLVCKQATSLKWIWNELTVIYQHQHQGKEFFTIADLEYKPDTDTALSFYTAYRARILENLKPAGTKIKWRNNEETTATEVISPTFEDHILTTVLHKQNDNVRSVTCVKYMDLVNIDDLL